MAGPGSFDPAKAEQSFKISSSDFFAEMLMPPLANELSRLAPNIQLQLVDLVPDNYVAILKKHGIDPCACSQDRLPGLDRFHARLPIGFRDDRARRPSMA